MDKDKLTGRTDQRAARTNSPASISISPRYIEDNVEEAASGVKGRELGQVVRQRSRRLWKTPPTKIKAVMANVPGITDLAVFNSLGQPTIEIDIDRAKAARYGLATGDINSTVQAAIGGAGGRQSLRDRQRPQFPHHRAAGAGIPRQPGRDPPYPRRRANPAGNGVIQIPLSRCRRRSGWYRVPPSSTASIRSATSRSSSVCAGAISAAPCWKRRRRSPEQVHLPPGYRLEWVGEFGELQEALGRLAIVVPISLALIGMLLYVNFGSLRRHAAGRRA